MLICKNIQIESADKKKKKKKLVYVKPAFAITQVASCLPT